MSFFSIGRSVPLTQNPASEADTPHQRAPEGTARTPSGQNENGSENGASTGTGRQQAPATALPRPGLLAGLRKRSTGLGHTLTEAIGGTVDQAGQKTLRGPTLPNHPIDARFVSTIRTGSKGRPLVPVSEKVSATPKPLETLPSIPEDAPVDALTSMRLPSASNKSDMLMQQALGRFSSPPVQSRSPRTNGKDAFNALSPAMRIEGVSTTGSIASLAALRVAMQQKFSATAPRADGGGTRELEAEILEASQRGTPNQDVAYARAGLLCDALSTASGRDANRARQILGRLSVGLNLNEIDGHPPQDAAIEAPVRTAAGTQRGRAMDRVTEDTQRAAAQLVNPVIRRANAVAAPPPHAANLGFEMPIELMQFGEGIADNLDALPLSAVEPPPASAAMDALAWRTAQHLARTTNGYACLQHIAGASWPNQEHDNTVSDAAVRAPRQWLLAADALVDAIGCGANPASVTAAAARHTSATTAGHSTTAAHASSIIQASAAVWSTGDTANLNSAQKGALLAARQGFYTDGPGSPFAATKGRLAKFVNHSIPRASAAPAHGDTQDNVGQARDDDVEVGEDNLDRADHVVDTHSDHVSVSKPRSRWAAAVRPFGKQKTAVASMRKGVQGANLGVLKKDRETLNNANAEVLTGLHAALSTDPTPRPLATSRIGKWMASSRALRAMVSDAELSVLAEAPPAYGEKIDGVMLDNIANRTAEAIAALPAPPEDARFREKRAYRATQALHRELTADPNVPGNQEKIRARIRKRLTNGSDVVDFAKLNAWQQRISKADAEGLQDDALLKNMRIVERIGTGAATRLTTNARQPDSDDYRKMGDEIIDHLESGGKAIFTEGGKVGISTRGLTATVASFPLLSPRLNLAASEGREASFEISRSTASYKIGIGTRDRLRVDVGGGVQIGHNFGIIRLSSNLEAEHEWDRTRQRGVELHIARRLNANGDGFDDAHAKTQMKAVNQFLFEQAGRGRNEQDLWNAMGERFLEHDDFSVAWNGQAGMLKRNRQTANARAGVKIGTGKISARANINAALTHDHVYRATMQSIDTSGQTQTESQRVGGGHRIGLQTAVNFTISDTVTQSPHDTTSEPTDVASVAMFAPNLMSFEVPLFDGFRQAKVTLVREKGETQVHSSNADTEFASVDDYARTLRSQPAWALAFGMAGNTPMVIPTTPEQRQAVIRNGQTKIETHLAELKANPLSNLRHVFRVRIRKQTAAERDAIEDLIKSATTERDAAAKRGDFGANGTQAQEATIARLTAKRDALLRGPNAWIPTELLTVQSLDRDFAAGVRMGLQVEMRDGSRGEHEMASLKLKPNEAEALDALWPTTP